MATKTCPFCAEQIQAEAIKCRFCGSRLDGGLRNPGEWHRGYPDRKLAGVCTSIAHNLGVSVTAVRAGFLLLALLHGVGILLYAVLWFVLPDGPRGRSGLDRAAEALRTLFGNERRPTERGREARPPAPPETIDHDEKGASGGWSPTRN